MKAGSEMREIGEIRRGERWERGGKRVKTLEIDIIKR